jgi:hypothetical protein
MDRYRNDSYDISFTKRSNRPLYNPLMCSFARNFCSYLSYYWVQSYGLKLLLVYL